MNLNSAVALKSGNTIDRYCRLGFDSLVNNRHQLHIKYTNVTFERDQPRTKQIRP